MKASHIIFALLAILLLASCNESAATAPQPTTFQNEKAITNNDRLIALNTDADQYNLQTRAHSDFINQIQQRKKLVPVRIPGSGMVKGSLPVPNTWNLTDSNPEILLQGPNGVQVYKEVVASFYHSPDEKMNKTIRESGSIVKPFINPGDLFTKEFKPLAESQGNTLIAHYPLKQIADNDSRIDAMYYKPNQVTTIFHASVSEWVDMNGNPSIVVIKHQQADYGPKLINWGYTITSMESNRSHFKQAKEDFLYALINYEVNPEYIQMVNTNTKNSAVN